MPVMTSWENYTQCDYVKCDGPRRWAIVWERVNTDGITVRDETRECSAHALDSKWDRHLGKPIAIRAL